MKKVLAVLLAVLMVCALSVTAFAASSPSWDVPDPGPTKSDKDAEQAEVITDLTKLDDEQQADLDTAQETIDALDADPKSNDDVAAAAGDEDVVLSGWYYVAAPGVKEFSKEDAANLVGVLFIPSGDTLASLLSLDGDAVTFPGTGMACDVFFAA